MNKNEPIILIQNTYYHFETLISLYQILKNLGYNPYIYKFVLDSSRQNDFLNLFNLNQANNNIIANARCGIVVSSYPNPQVDKKDSIPNSNNNIFSYLKNRLLYISHRFNDKKDYIDSLLNNKNTLCLSPLSKKYVDIDYIHLTDHVVVPRHNNISTVSGIKLSIQGHFELNNRNKSNLLQSIINFNEYHIYNIIFNIIGTKTSRILHNVDGISINRYDNLSEINFYNVLNNETHFILPMIDQNTKNQTYILERYSSSFNQSLALEKPLICHKIFEDIYEIPGIYYDDYQQDHMLDLVKNISQDQYKKLINNFKAIKTKFTKHNRIILEEKLDYVSKL